MNRATKIRPHQILALGQDHGKAFTSFIPSSFSGSMTAFESVVLIKILNLVNPRRVFEFGTFMGSTTRLLLDNLDHDETEDRKIYTLDLDSLDGVEFQGDDELLAKKVIGTKRLYEESVHADKVKQILVDSLKFDATSLDEKFNYILIDANHEGKYVKADSENAFKMLDKRSSFALIWDDYENPNHPELTAYVDSLTLDGNQIYHIEGTQFAILLSDDISIPKPITDISR